MIALHCLGNLEFENKNKTCHRQHDIPCDNNMTENYNKDVVIYKSNIYCNKSTTVKSTYTGNFLPTLCKHN